MLLEGVIVGFWIFGQYVNMLVLYWEVMDQWWVLVKECLEKINLVVFCINFGKVIEVVGDGYYIGGVFENIYFIVLMDGWVDIVDEEVCNWEEED